MVCSDEMLISSAPKMWKIQFFSSHARWIGKVSKLGENVYHPSFHSAMVCYHYICTSYPYSWKRTLPISVHTEEASNEIGEQGELGHIGCIRSY